MVEEGSKSKEERQKKNKVDWFRLLSQYAVMGRRKSTVIKEPGEDLGKNWMMVNEEQNKTPVQIAEEVLNKTSNNMGIGDALIYLSNQSNLNKEDIEEINCNDEENSL